jgi:hypothetical protein
MTALLLPTVLKARGRLSYIRHKNKQESSFSANGFVNGIQVSFADAFFTTIVKFLSILRVPSLAVMVTLLLSAVSKTRLVLSSLPLAISKSAINLRSHGF